MPRLRRTVLIIHDACDSSNHYIDQLQQDSACTYQVLTQLSEQSLSRDLLPQIDVILLILASDSDSASVMNRWQAQMYEHRPPIVVIGADHLPTAIATLKQGASDYLVQARLTAADLCSALTAAIEAAALQTSQSSSSQSSSSQSQSSQNQFPHQTAVEQMLDCFGICSAVRNAAGAIVDFRIDYLNAAACEKNQLLKTAQINSNLCQLLPIHRQLGLFDHYCHLVETGIPLIRDVVIYQDEDEQRLAFAFNIRAAKLRDGFVATWRDITDSKQLELELSQIATDRQQQHQQIQQLIDTAPIGISISSINGEIKLINDAMLQLYGYSRAEFEQQGLNWREPLQPELPQSDQEIDFLQPTCLVPQEKQLQRRDGSQVTALISVTQWLHHPEEQVVFAVNLNRQKQAEMALRASQRRYRELAEAMPQMVWTADTTGAVTYWNQRWYEYTGLSEAESLSIEAAVHPDDRRSTLAQWQQSIVQAKSLEIEYRIRDRVGEYHWFICRAVPTQDDEQITGWIGTLTNIDEIKRSAALMRHNQQQLQHQLAEIEAIYQSAPVGLAVVDCELRFVRINQRLAEINGLPVEDHIGRSVRELLPDLADQSEQLLRSVIETGEPLLNIEIQGETPAQPGMKRAWLEHFLPLKEGDRVIGISAVCEEMTERLQVEAALRQSEARFRTLADNISQFAWMADETGWIFWYNQRWLDYTGLTLTEMQGWGWRKVHHPDHVDRVVAKISHCFANRERWEDTFPLRSKDGQYRWFLSRAVPVQDEQGTVLRWFGTNTDITELRDTEVALKQATERLNIALKSAPMTLFNQDLELRYTWVHNPTQIDSVETIIGQRDQDLVSPETATHLTQLKRQVLKTGIGWREEVKVTKDEQVAYYDLTIDPIRDSRNAIVGITCAAVNISDRAVLEAERQQAEEALRQSEDRLRMAIESAELGTWDWNLISNELIWNAGCKAMFGLSPEAESSIDVFWAGLHPDDRERLQQLLQETLSPAGSGNYDTEYRTIGIQDGKERWIAAKGQAYFDTSGTPLRFTGIVMNITDQKLAEQEQEQLLTQEQLARAEAERANRIKDEFLAVLSHELRSPLNPILGWTKLLQTRKLDDAKTALALTTIERNAKLQTQLIDDLLDIAKILRGKLSLNVTKVNLLPVIEAALETISTAAVAKSIDLRFQWQDASTGGLPSAKLLISGDATRLQQVIWNLLSNAIKFTPAGGQVEVNLAIQTETLSELLHPLGVENNVISGLTFLKSYAQITVTDTGKGINPDFLPYLFESFRQEDASITRKYGGLGLGLAIVRQLVEAHGGTIKASSAGEGLGATFTLRLPLLDSEAEPESSWQSELTTASPSALAGIRVLAVDDDPDARGLIQLLLSELGAEVLTVASVMETLAVLDTFQPDILVSDIGMPEVDGYALIEQLRGRFSAAQIPAIALTAYARESDQQRAIASGYQRHLTKPLDAEQLLQAIVSLVQAKQAQ